VSRVVPAIAALLAAAIAVGIAGADAWRTAAAHGWLEDGFLGLVRDAFLHRFDRVAPVALGVLVALLVVWGLVRRRRPARASSPCRPSSSACCSPRARPCPCTTPPVRGARTCSSSRSTRCARIASARTATAARPRRPSTRASRPAGRLRERLEPVAEDDARRT
jgi:hypothetical protein